MGEYKTSNRSKILKFLEDNRDRSLSVKDIDSYMKSIDSPVNLTTIYRYLEKLEEEKRVIKYTSPKGDKTTYQLSLPSNRCDSHLHLKCTSCGEVTHLDCHFMEEIASHVGKSHGFEIQCRDSVIYGLCGKCRRQSRKK